MIFYMFLIKKNTYTLHNLFLSKLLLSYIHIQFNYTIIHIYTIHKTKKYNNDNMNYSIDKQYCLCLTLYIKLIVLVQVCMPHL